MKIKRIEIQNFRLFNATSPFVIDNINVPNGEKEGSGLTVLVGENGCGKTSILDAIALPLLQYKAESFSINDFNDPTKDCAINVYSNENFEYAGTMPKAKYQGKGFNFQAKIRKRANNSYLSSSVVQDQKFIKADGENKPYDNSPDLRISVNNPFSGPRFSENDILYLDKNRTYQIRSGTYNETRFDRLMEDFNYQYIKEYKGNDIPDLNQKLTDVKGKVSHAFLERAIEKFQSISGIPLSLSFINNWCPFQNSFFSNKKNDNILIPLSALGAGYEVIFSLLYSFYLSEQSGKQLIVLLDEPELHLHPRLQLEFVKFLLEASKKMQIILATHSPLLVKQFLNNTNLKIFICTKNDGGSSQMTSIQSRVLPYISANEVNYLAFQLPTEEFHNELYGLLQSKAIDEDVNNGRENKFDDWLQSKGLGKNKQWVKERNGLPLVPDNVTLQVYIRNTIHHPENRSNEMYTPEEMKQSISEMISVIKSLN